MGGYAPALGLQALQPGNGGQLPDQPVPYFPLSIFQPRNLVRIGETPALCDAQKRINALIALEQAEDAFSHVKSLSNKPEGSIG